MILGFFFFVFLVNFNSYVIIIIYSALLQAMPAKLSKLGIHRKEIVLKPCCGKIDTRFEPKSIMRDLILAPV